MTRHLDLILAVLWVACWVGLALLLSSAFDRLDAHVTPAWTVPPSAITTTWSAPERTPTPTLIRLPRGTGTEADQSPAATHEVPAVSTALATARPAAAHPRAALVATGTASCYPAGPGRYAALPGPGRAGRWVRVCSMHACRVAPVVTTCGCAGPPPKVIDLSPQLWEAISGFTSADRWRLGVIPVSVTVVK